MQFGIEWSHGSVQVEPVGAMLGPVRFRLGDRWIEPLAVAPWSDDTGPDHDVLPPLLKRLRGEWPCVPFGAPEPRRDLPAQWQVAEGVRAGRDFHGFSSHNAWHKVAGGASWIELQINYPADHPVRRLSRRIMGIEGRAAIDIHLEVEARDDTRLPIALHPVFRLPDAPGNAVLEIAAEGGWTYPVELEPGRSLALPDREFRRLEEVPARDGRRDYTRLPLDVRTEDLLQVRSGSGSVSLLNHEEGYRATLDYDADVFPCVALWVSNGGREAYPWNGRFRGLGIEPVAGAFDLGAARSLGDNPINASGVRTWRTFSCGAPQTISYRIGVAEAVRHPDRS